VHRFESERAVERIQRVVAATLRQVHDAEVLPDLGFDRIGARGVFQVSLRGCKFAACKRAHGHEVQRLRCFGRGFQDVAIDRFGFRDAMLRRVRTRLVDAGFDGLCCLRIHVTYFAAFASRSLDPAQIRTAWIFAGARLRAMDVAVRRRFALFFPLPKEGGSRGMAVDPPREAIPPRYARPPSLGGESTRGAVTSRRFALLFPLPRKGDRGGWLFDPRRVPYRSTIFA